MEERQAELLARPVGGLGWTGAADAFKKSSDAAGGGRGQKGEVQRDTTTLRMAVVR